MLAAERGDVKLVSLLINSNADVSAKAQFGHTALRSAILHNHPKVVKSLLNAGASAMDVYAEGDFPPYVSAAARGSDDGHLKQSQKIVIMHCRRK